MTLQEYVKVIKFQPEAVKAYLDECIRDARRKRDDTGWTADPAYICYIDAYQSVRTSLFGETLPEESDQESLKFELASCTTTVLQEPRNLLEALSTLNEVYYLKGAESKETQDALQTLMEAYNEWLD